MLLGIDQLLASAEQAHRAGRLQEAEQHCRQVLARDPRNTRALVLIGILNAKTGRAPQGIQILKNAALADPNSFDAHLWLGVIIGAGGNPAEAIAYANRAVELRPKDSQALSSLSNCFMALREPSKAIPYLERAIAVEPRVAPLRQNLGDALQKAERIDEAIQAYEKCIELSPQSSIGYIRLAECLRRKNRHDEAAVQVKKAFDLTPDNAQSLMQLAQLLIQAGLQSHSIKAIERVIAKEPKNAAAYAALGTVYQQLGQFQPASINLEKALELQPSIAHAYVDLANCKRMTPEDQPFVDKMLVLVKDRSLPQDSKCLLHYALGKSFDDLGDYKLAMQQYHEANGIMLRHLAAKPFDRALHTEDVNFMIRTFTPGYFAEHTELNNPSDLPIQVVGMIRSGTTLVEQIISSHPTVAAAGERDYLRKIGYRVLQPEKGAPHLEEAKKVAEGYLELLSSLDPTKQHVTDKMPINFMMLGLTHALFPNARLIHCRRNALDTAISIYTTYFHEPVNIAHDPATIVFFYKEYLRMMDHWRKVLPPDRFMEIDYEEIVADREAATRKLIAFCGLEWDDACLHHERNKGAIMTPSWWQARQPVYTTSVARWKNYEPWLGEFKKLL